MGKSSRLAPLLQGPNAASATCLDKSSRLAPLLRGGAAALATYWEKARDLRRSYGVPTWLQRRTWKMARGWRRSPKRLRSHVGAARAASLSSCRAVITPSCCRRKRWRCDDGPCARGGAVIWRRWSIAKELAACAAPTGGRCGFSDVLGKGSRLASLLRGSNVASTTYLENGSRLAPEAEAASLPCRSGASREPFVLSGRDHAFVLPPKAMAVR